MQDRLGNSDDSSNNINSSSLHQAVGAGVVAGAPVVAGQLGVVEGAQHRHLPAALPLLLPRLLGQTVLC